MTDLVFIHKPTPGMISLPTYIMGVHVYIISVV